MFEFGEHLTGCRLHLIPLVPQAFLIDLFSIKGGVWIQWPFTAVLEHKPYVCLTLDHKVQICSGSPIFSLDVTFNEICTSATRMWSRVGTCQSGTHRPRDASSKNFRWGKQRSGTHCHDTSRMQSNGKLRVSMNLLSRTSRKDQSARKNYH
jgi:hypothetical protein